MLVSSTDPIQLFRDLFQVLIQWWMQQSLRYSFVQVFRCDQNDTSVDALFNRFSLEVLDHGFDSEITHLKRILYDNTVQFVLSHRVDKFVGCIKPYMSDFASLVPFGTGQFPSPGSTFIRSEYTLN